MPMQPNLVFKSTHEYKVHGEYGSNHPCTSTIGARGPHNYGIIMAMDFVFMSTFNGQSMSIG